MILVGHSTGGACVSYALELFPEKISKAVFICATMVSDGQRPFDVFADQVNTKQKKIHTRFLNLFFLFSLNQHNYIQFSFGKDLFTHIGRKANNFLRNQTKNHRVKHGLWSHFQPSSSSCECFCLFSNSYKLSLSQLGSAERFMKESQFLIHRNGKDKPATGFTFEKQHMKSLYFNQSPNKVNTAQE